MQFQLHLVNLEEKLITNITQLFAKLLKENQIELLQTFVILISFFSNFFSGYDKKLLSFLSAIPKEELSKFTHIELRKIGIILLSSNMPRTSSFFFYKPRKDSRKIKFFTYFDCCKRLASIKANKKGYADGTGEELRRSRGD
jgi:hypothetical protein